jgi:hypothetical protein
VIRFELTRETHEERIRDRAAALKNRATDAPGSRRLFSPACAKPRPGFTFVATRALDGFGASINSSCRRHAEVAATSRPDRRPAHGVR